MKNKGIVILLVITLMLVPTLAFAASPWVDKTTYGDKISGKFTFGLTNTLLGWVDLFYEPNRYQNEGKNVWSGVGKGLVDTVANTVGGAFHLVTFMIPVDFPLPEDGIDLGGGAGSKSTQ